VSASDHSGAWVTISRLFDVGAWCMFLGAAAYLGVYLDRYAYDMATTLTGTMALVGAGLMIIRWGVLNVRREK
jgi:hypothetical protein